MGSIRDQAMAEAEAARPAPVVSATTLQNTSLALAPGSEIHCATVSDALRLEGLFRGELARDGMVLRASKEVSLRIFFDRAYGMYARRVP